MRMMATCGQLLADDKSKETVRRWKETGEYVVNMLMLPPDPVRVDARRWSGLRYTWDRRRDSSTNHRCAKIGCNCA